MARSRARKAQKSSDEDADSTASSFTAHSDTDAHTRTRDDVRSGPRKPKAARRGRAKSSDDDEVVVISSDSSGSEAEVRGSGGRGGRSGGRGRGRGRTHTHTHTHADAGAQSQPRKKARAAGAAAADSDAEPAEAEDDSGGAWWKKRLEELDEPEDEELDIESRVFPSAPQPAGLLTSLLPFQSESLWWMQRQEASAFKGGLLADEMGMGKTVQAIALMVASKEAAAGAAAAGTPSFGDLPAPRSYEGEGIVKMREDAKKQAAKLAKAAAREQERERKAFEKAAKAQERADKRAAAAAAKKKKGGVKADTTDDAKPDVLAEAPSAPEPAETANAADLIDAFLATDAGPVGDDASAQKEAAAGSATHAGCAAACAGPAEGAAPIAPEWKPLAVSSSPLDTLAPPTACSTTLVVCPVVALTQWRFEILRHTAPGTLSVYCYHGPNRSTSLEELQKYDVILTTYSILEGEFRKMMEPTKVHCEYCGKSFLPEKLRIHLRYFCGPDAIKTAAQAKQQRTRDAGRPSGAARGWRAQESSGGESSADNSSDSSYEEEDTESEVAAAPAKQASAKKASVKKPSAKRASSAKPSAAVDDDATWVASSTGKATPKPTPKGTPRKASASAGKRSKSTPASRSASASKVKSSAQSKKRRRASSSSEDDDSDFSFASSAESESDGASEASLASGDEDVGASPKPRKSRAKSPAAAAAPPRTKKPIKLGPLSLLQRIHWKRIILDEAHAIKNKRCATARAVFNLTAENRWCLSGTPLQNRVAELFSLLRFLRVEPYAKYFCKNCPCASFDYKFDEGGRECELCGHSPLRHYNWLNRYVMNPIKQYGYMGPGRDAMIILRREVLDGMLLRRTKQSRAADLSLPGRNVLLRNDLELDPFETDFYEALYTQSQAKFAAYVTSGTLLNNYAHIFDLLTRLRQAVDHPYLILHGSEAATASAPTLSYGDGAGAHDAAPLQDICGICRESVEDPVVSGCRHIFCRLCMREYLESLGGRALSLLQDKTNDEDAYVGEREGDDDGDGATTPPKKARGKKKKAAAPATSAPGDGAAPVCPTCFAPITVDLAAPAATATAASTRKSILARIPQDRVGRFFRSSTKIEALLEDLWRAQLEEPGTKAIVFSQFVNMLDLIQHRLSHAAVRCVKMDGSMSVAARDRVINSFRDDPHVTVFLISLKAGGVALNLTAASRIYLMDPWWNPAAEFQAMDRTHRLGQHRSITAVRFIVRNTIEERIVALQEKKRLVFEGTVGQDTASLARLTEEDMRFLFA